MGYKHLPDPDVSSKTCPVYPIFTTLRGVGACYTGKGTSPTNHFFSFHRPSSANLAGARSLLIPNLTSLSNLASFDYSKITWPNGGWPHSGHVIKAEDHKWIVNDKTGGIMPINEYDQAVTYDGIVTGSRDFVLGVQGADCPALFLFDPETRVIGLAHAGWKPVVRGVVRNILDMMEKMGCQLRNIQAFISPGAGDQYNKFQWGERMEPHVENVFVQACRESLLNEMEIRHELSEAEQEILSLAIGRHTGGSTSFKLSALVCQELQTGGLLPEKISKSDHSSIVGRYPVENAGQGIEYRYHSFRREQPIHGLSMSVMFLKQDKD